MTANELADELERMIPALPLKALIKSATMLRQQQAELDAFKLNYYNTGYSLQLRDKDETIKQQQAEIEQLKALIISLSPNANLIYTKVSENEWIWRWSNPFT